MGTWFYLINISKRQYIFLGRGKPMFAGPLSLAIDKLGWSLTDELTLIPDSDGWERVLYELLRMDPASPFEAWYYKERISKQTGKQYHVLVTSEESDSDE